MSFIQPLREHVSVQLLNEGVIINTFLLYHFLKRLVTPFNKTKAFELGIIDENGKVLKSRRDLSTKQERDAFGLFDVLVFNLKKLLGKLPGGKTRLASFAAALLLLREHEGSRQTNTDDIEKKCVELMQYLFENPDVIDMLETDSMKDLLNNDEEVHANNAGSGNIAGLDGSKIPEKSRKKYKKKNKDEEKELEIPSRKIVGIV